ncbi:Ger(x)C family spore germination protein [Acetohalobium arabaticum]|uniref:Germination protein, Ger(X)C family n=1 Tax=Acetohalobium arabaticum (strain ATCC 49924 / DSM 5501 / Z-7288) TaxID=574087 RepID=D9QRB1_ACEAZ|nr:Ger(x)C family spore germination protein [Acetohalobium arabaticum]ADL13052.1 germination protein, Ger(x)C family [Acetohalobium arabaticum DSM 5501]
MKPANLKKTVILLLILSLAITLSGCWSAREFDTLALVKGVGIDLAEKEDRIKFTIQMISPNPQQGGGQPGGGGGQAGQSSQFWTTSTTGYSIFEANRNLVKTIGRKPFYPHTEVYIIGEELARQGIKPYIDFFNRDPEIRRRAYIIIAKGEAEDILKAPHGVETVPILAVKQIIDGQSISGSIYSTNLREFTVSALSNTTDPVTAAVELRPGGPEEEGEENKDNLIYINGAAMFKGDKLVDWLTRKETRGLNWVQKPSEIIGPVLIKAPDEDKRIGIEVLKATSSVEPELEDGEFKMKVEITVEGNISEAQIRKYDITKVGNITHLDQRFAQVIKNEIINGLQKSQQYQADIFGFGETIRNKYPQEFKEKQDNWDQIYSKLPVTIEVKSNIRRPGMVKEGIGTYK